MADETSPNVETPPETPPAPDRNADRDRRKREALQAENAELRQFKAAHESSAREASDNKLREAEEWGKLESGYQTKVRGLEEKLKTSDSKLTGKEEESRRRVFVDAILGAGEIGNRKVVDAMLPELGLADSAPENFTDGDVKKAVDALNKAAPELFGSTTTHNRKPSPGGGRTRPDPNTGEYWRQRAAQLDAGSMSPQYLQATGRDK